MNAWHTLIFLIFINYRKMVTTAALQDGTARIPIHTAAAGGSIIVECQFSSTGHKRFFCKDKCEKGNILIETADDWARSGRYSIQYKDVLYVNITQLEQSDSGLYRCSSNRTGRLESDCEFEIVVRGDLAVFKKEALMVLLLPFVLVLICKKNADDCGDLNNMRNPDSSQTEIALQEAYSPVSPPDSSIYESLDPASRDLDQIYYTLTPTQQCK